MKIDKNSILTNGIPKKHTKCTVKKVVINGVFLAKNGLFEVLDLNFSNNAL